MFKNIYCVGITVLSLTLLIAIVIPSTVFAQEKLTIEKIFPNNYLSQSYESFTGYDTTQTVAGTPPYSSAVARNYFGVYPMHTRGDNLYLGIGTSLPAHTDGAALARYQEGDTSFTYLEKFNEQGILGLGRYGENIVLPGADPCCGDLLDENGNPGVYNHQWDWGNLYITDTQTAQTTKRRNIPNTLHGWGSWHDTENDILYYAGSGTLADTPDRADATNTGYLWSTSDGGDTWIDVAGGTTGAGTWRTYDVIGIGDTLYTQMADYSAYYDCGIAKSTDGGSSWIRLPNLSVVCYSRLYNVGGNLITLAAPNPVVAFDPVDHTKIHEISPDGTVQTHDFKDDFTLTYSTGSVQFISAYHFLAQDMYDNVYIPTSDGRIMHTLDFETWSEVASAEESIEFSAITYWDEKEKLVVSNWGDSANVWTVDIPNTDKNGLPDVLEASQEIPIFRFYSKNYKAHFYTISRAERDAIIQNDPNWSYEGESLKVYNDQKLGQSSVHRFYSENYKSHFYTISEAEKDAIIQNDPNWSYEGTAWDAYIIPRAKTRPLYRFYSESYRSHFYTISESERDSVIANDPNWNYEGIAYYVSE